MMEPLLKVRNYNNMMMKSYQMLRVRVMVFNATFNNISAISWQSFLLVKDTGVPG
jgi:hypothetical protein